MNTVNTNKETCIQYTITENVTDHEGYKGQPVYIKETHEDGYFTVTDGITQWHCDMNELTEVKETSIQHTKGEWNVYRSEKGKDGCSRAYINSALPNDMYETICTMSGLNGTEPGETAIANAERICKVINNHDALINALKNCIAELKCYNLSKETPPVIAAAMEALKNAE